jgi:2-dehydro-3-deoxyphosphogluconate aldolase / (4S)-4-hydroxy-2-oxoglutarate aldolase
MLLTSRGILVSNRLVMTDRAASTSDHASRTLDAILQDGVVLAVRMGPGPDVLAACRAAVRGGLKILEITLTTPGAIEAMATMAREPGVLAGGGTVLTAQAVRDVARAGGRFALSPVFDRDVVDEARRLDLLAIPGAATPAEILAAHRYGVPVVKVFPAAALGGPAFLRYVRGPFPDIRLLPTSGPTSENLADYFAAGACAVGVGAEVFPPGFTSATVEAAARRIRQAMPAR